MINKNKILIIMIIFLIFIPGVKANVFDDIKEINKGIKNANEKLTTIQNGIDDMNNKTQNVSESVRVIKDTNQGIKDMSDKLDEVSNRISDALDITENIDTYVDDIKLLMTIGVITVILAIITLIGSTIIIVKKRK